jgi:hypothetical protein
MSQAGEVLARKPLDNARPLVRRCAAERHERGCDVQVRGDGATLLAARVGWVGDDQGHVVLLAVRDRAFGVQLVGAVHVAVVRGEDHDRPVGEA